MNIQRWKGTIWIGSLVSGGLLVSAVYGFLRDREELAIEVPDERLSAVLDSVKKPAEQKSDHVEYRLVERVFNLYDWSGKEKPKPVEKPDGGAPPPVPKVPVASLLRVLAIKVDTAWPARSLAYVKFVDQKLSAHTQRDDLILRPEERLFEPYQDVRVAAITAEGVRFAFDDTARPEETVAPPPYVSSLRGDLGIVLVGPDGIQSPPVRKQIGSAAPDAPLWNPEQLTQIRKNEWQVGTATLEELDRDYSRILSRDISYQTHKNPRNGEAEGIKVNYVRPDSIPARAGVTEGEVLKSINGHKVTSVNDAVAFVKANANTTSSWIGLFEKQGREFTRTYHSPR
ncbi:MAG TPA: PDZ domain-containing protein [Planctomycetota bacterium]